MKPIQLVVGTINCPIIIVEKILCQDETIQGKWSTFASGMEIANSRIKKLRQDIFLDKINHLDVIIEILEIWVGEKGSEAKLDYLIEVVEDKCGAFGVGEFLRLEFNLSCRKLSRSSFIDWNDLSLAFKAKVNSNVKKYFPYPGVEVVMPKLKGDMLVSLMIGERPSIFNKTLPEKLGYYVHRTLITRNIISNKIFQQDSPDIFLFTGMDRYELSELAKDKLTSISSEQLDTGSVTTQFILLNQERHFQKISERTTRSVHLLRKEKDGRFRWVRSKGKMETLQKYVNPAQDELDEEALCKYLDSDGDNSPRCISDSPGMGKSVLLAQLGRKLETLYPDRTVVLLLASNFVQQVKQNGYTDKDKITPIKKALLNLICDCILGKIVINAKLDTGEGIGMELMLDGFDEVSSQDSKLAHEILETISSSLKTVRLWVTSRPHHLVELECSLNVFGFNIKSFDKINQVQFLCSFWSQNVNLNQEKLRQLANECLELIQRNLNSTDHHIAGIPLQCLLIGEVFEEEAKDYGKEDSESSTSHHIEINSITNLYRRLVEKKIQKYVSSHGGTRISRKKLINMHARLSLEQLFPDQITDLLSEIEFSKVQNNYELNKIGIVESSTLSTGSSPRFIHRTFAEYFIACFVIQMLMEIVAERSHHHKRKVQKWFCGTFQMNGKGSNEEAQAFLFREVLKCQNITVDLIKTTHDSCKFTHPVIIYFLNALLAEQFQTAVLPQLVSAPIRLKESFNSPKIIRQLAYALASSNFIQIFKFLLELCNNQMKTIFDYEFLLLTIKQSGLELVKLAFAYFEENGHLLNLTMKTETVRIAVQRGDFSIMEFLIKEKHLGHVLEVSNSKAKTVLHDCVEGSSRNSGAKVEQKIQIIRMINGINPKLLEGMTEKGDTPVFSYHVHIKLLTELIRLGVKVSATDEKDGNICHLTFCRDHLSSEDYYQLVKSIPTIEMMLLANAKLDNGQTPLATLVEKLDPTPHTLEMFKNARANFNLVDEKKGYSLLALAIARRRSANTLRKLIECGASTAWRGKEGETLLHVSAAKGNLEAVGILVKECRMNVNVVDEVGHTPMDYLIKSSCIYGARFESGLILHGRGGKFRNVVNSNGQSWLHVVVGNGNLQSVRLLLHIGIDVNAVDNVGNTPLHMTVAKWNQFEYPIIKLLLENHANPNTWNKNGETPFHLQIRNGNLGMNTFQLFKSKTNLHWTPALATLGLNFVVQKGDGLSEDVFNSLIRDFETFGADYNYVDSEGNSLIHVAINSGNDRAVRLIMDRKGTNIISKINQLKENHCLKITGELPKPEILKYLVSNGYTADNLHQRLCDSHAVPFTQQKLKLPRILKSSVPT